MKKTLTSLMTGVRKSRKSIVLIMSMVFITPLLVSSSLIEDVRATDAGPETPSLILVVDKIEKMGNDFAVNGTVTAKGPHDREWILDAYWLSVDMIIKENDNSRYPNFKESAYEPESIAAYYPDAKTPYTPGSGPGDTMTLEEAYGINVTTIELFSSSELGEYDFEEAIPVGLEGRMFRIQATLQWDYKSVRAYWWAHRFFNKIGYEGTLGESYEFLYSDGAEIVHADGRKESKFAWRTDWPSDENLTFTFTKKRSYLGICGGSILGDESVSGKITPDKITIKKSSSDIPVEFTSLGSHCLVAGEGEVSIVPEVYDENGTMVCKGWGHLMHKKMEELTNYIWKNKISIAVSTGGGLFIKLTTGIPGFLLTLPTKYAARALGYLTTPESVGQEVEKRAAIEQKFQELQEFQEWAWEYAHGRARGVYHSDGYIEVNEDTTTVYVTGGEATLADINNTKTVNITSGNCSTIKAGGVPTDPEPFNEDEVRERSGITMDTLWSSEAGGEIVLSDHILCKNVDSDGNPVKATTIFTTDDMVYSWVSIANASEGDEVRWLFQGPNGITEEYTYPLEWDGEGYCWDSLDLNGYNMEDAVGDWSVTVTINGVEAFTDQFTVEPLTGLVWWGPIIGLLIIAVPVSFAIIITIILIKRRKT